LAYTNRTRTLLASTSILAAVVAVWWAASRNLPAIVLPSPWRVLATLCRMAIDGTIVVQVWHTLARVALSFSIAMGLALLLAFLVSSNKATMGMLEGLIMLLQSVPSAIWIVLAVIWFGIGGITPIFVVWAIAFPILAVNAVEGVKNVDSSLVEMGQIFGHGRESIFSNIVLPGMFPHLLSGSRVSFSLSWKVSVIAEVLGAQNGIGYAISFAWERLRTDQIFVWAIVIVVLIQAFDRLLFRRLEGRVKRYDARH